MARTFKAATGTPYGPRKCLEARVERNGRKPLVARFGGIPLRRQKDAVISDRVLVPGVIRHKELVTRLLADRWTVVTADKSLSAHFEHTIAITDDGPEVLTAADAGRALRAR